MRRALAAAALVCALPASAQAFVAETVMVPMRDGTRLATDVFRPSEPGPWPTLLIRTTYGREFIPDEAAQVICDGMGFAVVSQDTRGRYDSEGIDDVFQSDGWGENQDGYDTVDWIASQPWSDQQVGLFGASALGITSYLAMGSLHPAIKAAHVGIAPWIFYNTVYPGGTFRTALITDWLEGQGSGYMIDLYYDHPVYDEQWASLDMRQKGDQIDIPVFHWGGWHDIFTEGPVEGFEDLDRAGNPAGGLQRLVMGPWTHLDGGAFSQRQGELTYPANSYIPLVDANPIDWFAKYLQGKRVNSPTPDGWPIRYYLMGPTEEGAREGNLWELAQRWPIPSNDRLLYLQPGSKLNWTAPADLSEPDSFLYDPADPQPTIGGRELSLPAGPRDQNPLRSRSDLLVYETAPLTRSVKVVGKIRAVLFASSDAPDTDFVVRVNDVYPDGRAMLVTDGVMKARYRFDMREPRLLEAGEVAELEIDLNYTAQVFGKGHKIQVMVSSSNYRRFEPSKNLPDIWTDEPGVPALNSVYHDEVYASHLVLPEPRTGTVRPAPGGRAPSEATIARAKRKFELGGKLTDTDRAALSFEAGRQLMHLVTEAGMP